LLGLLLPVLGIECGLRVFGPALAQYGYVGLDARRNLSYFELHPVLGGFHVPNSTTWQWTMEYVTRVDINAHGLREREIEYQKPPGLWRILVLGDSFVEAAEVMAEDSMPRRLEAALNEGVGPPVQVINAGVVGYGTAQEYLLLQQEGVRYQPDVVVLVFFSGNDVTDNGWSLDFPYLRPIKPYFEVDGSGQLRQRPFTLPDLSATQPGPLRRWLRRESLLFGKLDGDELGKVTRNADYIRAIVAPYAAAPSPEVDASWQVTEALIRAVRDQTEASGARFVLVNVPAPWEIDPPFWERMRTYFGLPADGWDVDQPNRRLAEIVARQGFTYLDLRPDLRAAVAAGQRPGPYFQIDGHWTRAGHELAGRSIAQSGFVSAR
ncbi:MAG: SGNH/GDSL hydrolase family protein, partial [Chloroflexota bacterium]